MQYLNDTSSGMLGDTTTTVTSLLTVTPSLDVLVKTTTALSSFDFTTQAMTSPPLISSRLQGLVTKATLDLIFKANSVVVIFLIGLLGSILSLLNTVVFFKQGLKDPVTVTLFVLAIADFGSVLALWLRSVFFILMFFPGAIPNVDPSYFSGLFTWPHAILVRVSCFLTVFIAFERWVCITFPLHASRIITLSVAKAFNFVTTACMVATFISLYSFSRVKLMFLPHRNQSFFIVTLTEQGIAYGQVMTSFYTTVYMTTFALLIVFTFLIVIKLNQQTKWRQSLTSPSSSSSTPVSDPALNSTATTTTDTNTTNTLPDIKTNKSETSRIDAISVKNRKVVRMVAAMCVIYILFTIPSVTNSLVYIYLPGYVEFGQYYNLYQLNNQICFTFEVVNSTCNFFIYFKMSSNFVNTLRSLLGRDTK